MKVNHESRVLNVGCGLDTYGTDFLDLYPKRKDVIKHDADKEKIPYPDNTFDEVYSKCLFEHLNNPLFFLKESFRVLKKGGKIVLITDNAGCSFFHFKINNLNAIAQFHYKNILDKKWRTIHYALFTPCHLYNWLNLVGFKRIKTIYKNPNTIKWNILSVLSKKFFSLWVVAEGQK